MGNVAPPGSDILKTMIETSCEALEQAMLVVSSSDTIVFASRNLQKFYPVPEEFIKPGVSLRNFFQALFATGIMNGVPGEQARRVTNTDEWIAERIAGMWAERSEKNERLGRERWLSVTTRRLGNGLGFMILRDISAFTKMEERWRTDMERASMTEEILDKLPSPLSVKDRNLSYVAVNKAYCSLLGISADSILGSNAWDMMDAAIAEQDEAEERLILETGISDAIEIEILAADRRVVKVMRHRIRIGKPGHYFIVVALLPLGTDNKQGVETDLSTVEIIADVPSLDPVHDISLDESEEVDAVASTQEADAGHITDAGHIIVYSKDAQFGAALSVALSAFHFDAIHIEETEELNAVLAAAKVMGATVDLVVIDPESLRQSPGLRAGTVQFLEIDKERPLHFIVADTASVIASKFVNSGVPLASSKSGYHKTLQSADQNIPASSFLELEVLVAEDNAINQDVYAHLLNGLGISHKIAADGQEVVMLWEELRPPLVLMDTTLPVLTGMEAAKCIREAEAGSGKRTVIIGVLPLADEHVRQACLEAGMDEVIVKPLNIEVIERLYRKHVLENFSVSSAYAGV